MALLGTLRERLGESAGVVPGAKRACVALLLRLSPRCDAYVSAEWPLRDGGAACRVADLEALFILRAVNKRDRWGGQVGLPGGRQQSGETDRQTCAREVREEIGVSVPEEDAADDPSGFAFVGRALDRQVLQGKNALVVSCFVFMETRRESAAMTLEPSEVAACGWHPVGDLLRPDCGEPIIYDIGLGVARREHPLAYRASQVLRLDKMLFTKVPLHIDPLFVAGGESSAPLDAEQERLLRDAFFCWGMTLGILNDVLVSQGKLRERRISVVETVPWLGLTVERVFTSTAHNLAVYALRRAYTSATGEPGLPFSAYVVYYPVMVGLVGLAGLGTSVRVAATRLRALL
jgi:8-oxo-dGTP pyrophosphatase MutT (NUDIX family)